MSTSDATENKPNVSILRSELDLANQKLYDQSREIRRLLALEVEYRQDIEILEDEKKKLEAQYVKHIQQLEDKLSNQGCLYNETRGLLDSDLKEKNEKIASLTSEIDLLRKIKAAENSAGDISDLIDEINNLKINNNACIEENIHLKDSLKAIEEKNHLLVENVLEYKTEINNLKECLSHKRKEVTEAKHLMQQLNDDILCLKKELNTYKAQPLDSKSKGNSLFAEVDDRRVYLQGTISNMKQDYLKVKEENSMLLDKIRDLKIENSRFLERWHLDNHEKEDDEDRVNSTYLYRIESLEYLIEKYKKDLEKDTSTKFDDKYYDVVLQQKNAEIANLRDRISDNAITVFLNERALKKANAEKRKWQVEATLKQYLLDLKSQDNLHVSDIPKIRQDIERKIEEEERSPKPRENLKHDHNALDNLTEKNTNAKEVISIDDSLEASKTSPSMKECPEYTEKENIASSAECNSHDPPKEKKHVDDKTGVKKRVIFTQNTISPKTKPRSRITYIAKPTYIE